MKHLQAIFSSLFLGTTLTFPALGQITSDGTTNTTITPTDNGFQIDDGDVAGGNLFHSFRDFSVPTGREAFFNNATDIVNIFSRVTGGNISSIDGLIRANGSANLFLINPAGIMFRSNASLQLGGSFYSSTADSIIFPDGEFSATNLDNPPLITINAPIGLGNVRDNGGDIVGQSVDLTVEEGQNITFKGNNISFEDFAINAPGGDVTFEANKDINLSNGFITTSPFDSVVESQNITFKGNNILFENFTLETTAGDITLEANKDINLSNGFITTSPFDSIEATEAGDIVIRSGSAIQLFNTTIDPADFNPNGQTGNITIQALNGGNINLISDDFLSIIFTDSFGEIPGRQTGGNLHIIGGEINIDGYQLNGSVRGASNGGNISIIGDSVAIQNETIITTETFSNGNAGNINIIATDNFSLIDSHITSSTNGRGNAGDISITAKKLLFSNARITAGINREAFSDEFGFDVFEVDSELFLFDESGNLLAENDDSDPAIGAAGSTSNLNSFIQYTFSEDGTYIIGVGAFESFAGEEGIVGNTIPQGEDYTLQVSIQNHPFQSDNNGLVNQNDSNNSLQSAQNIDNDFTLTFDPNIQDSNNIPHVSISATGDGTFDYYSFEATQGSTGIFDIDQISTNTLDIDQISTNTLDNINLQAGTINITATGGNVEITNSNISTSTIGGGNGGNININSPNSIILRENTQISTQAFNNSNGGNIKINADFVVAFPNQNNDIIARARGGTGGNIIINAVDILGLEIRDSQNNNNTNDIDNISEVDPQLNGILEINTTNVDIRSQVKESPENFVEQETVTQVCSVDAEEENSSFIIKGKGGVPSAPTAPLSADLLLVEREPITPNNAQLTNVETISKIPSHIKPLKTSQGDIYPARGIIKTEDGRVILTAYPTDSRVARTSNSVSCHGN
ncbi:MAG: filamentous hemagglutinin N-terminal domain-containing protein [Xenococcaceae cyanobacterium MO_207.B15]|nr:filamentous hemagglutinin N-terminal domain-containing protein [Xenococcaceae cyanobacterium MO_207.B15]